jgi:proteasome activator subunit 4
MSSNDRVYTISLSYSHTQVCTSPKWHGRRAAIEFTQSLIFYNLFNARPYAKRLHELVLKCLFDEQFEVRIVASTTLAGFYQCGYIEVTDEDLVGSFDS